MLCNCRLKDIMQRKSDMSIDKTELGQLLDELYTRYNSPAFIEKDPISIPHAFEMKEDVEIAGFFAATLAWGKRDQIIKKANVLMELMDNEPFNFVSTASEEELSRLSSFYYRTFQSVDALFFVKVLRKVYDEGGLEQFVTQRYKETGCVKECLMALHAKFLSVPHQIRSMKHVANVAKGSSAKRLNMFLRWMVRKDTCGVDFGIWNDIPSAALYIPLDVHSGNSARALGLLSRKQNDWKAVAELTNNLKEFDAEDPVKYDFALFGAGIEGLLPR